MPDKIPTNLKVTVLDKDQTKADDFLGEVKIPMASIMSYVGQTDQWYSLQPKKTKPQERVTGSIRLRMQYEPGLVRFECKCKLKSVLRIL